MIKINITIEADSVEEAKNAFAQLGSVPVETTSITAPIDSEYAAHLERAKGSPTTRTRKAAAAEPAKPEATVVPINNADPLGSALAPATDPLAASALTTAPAADPLAPSGTIPAPAADPLAAPATTAPAKPTTISLQTIREKIGTLTEKKQQAKDLIATYKKADGTPCEKPSDIQESDYESVYNDLDYI